MVQHHHRRNFWLVALVLSAPGISTAQERGPLTTVPGDAQRGLRLAADAEKGNCVICHAIPGETTPPGGSGDIGPPLDGVGGRYSPSELRQRIVDPKALNLDTVMPGYHVTEKLHRVQDRYAGRPILTAPEIEDIVAYLITLQ